MERNDVHPCTLLFIHNRSASTGHHNANMSNTLQFDFLPTLAETRDIGISAGRRRPLIAFGERGIRVVPCITTDRVHQTDHLIWDNMATIVRRVRHCRCDFLQRRNIRRHGGIRTVRQHNASALQCAPGMPPGRRSSFQRDHVPLFPKGKTGLHSRDDTQVRKTFRQTRMDSLDTFDAVAMITTGSMVSAHSYALSAMIMATSPMALIATALGKRA